MTTIERSWHRSIRSLHEAVANGWLDCARYLLEQGHDPNATAHVLCDDRLGWSILHCAVKAGHDEMVGLLLDWKADPDFPGWMWTTARDAAAGTRFEEALAVPRLARPKFTPHRAEIERQLLLGQPDGVSVDWRGSRPAGPVKQLGGQPLQGADDLRLLDSNGEVVKRGRFRLLILTAEQDLRCFWLEQEGVVPDSVLAALTEDQRSDLVMDPRNREFRADLDRRNCEGWGACPQG